MATGARPFDILPRSALSAAIQHQPHMPMRQLAPHHPVQLERIIDTLLAKHPDDRYQSAATLRAELDALHRGDERTIAGDGARRRVGIGGGAAVRCRRRRPTRAPGRSGTAWPRISAAA